MCGGGGGKPQTVYQQQLPGPLTDRMAYAADRAVALSATPFEAYHGPRTANLRDSQWAAMRTAGDLTQYNAGQVGATQATAAQINAPGGWSIEGKDLSGYTNPWENAVVRATASDIDAATEQAKRAAAGRAALAGAWGGTGGDVEQAQIAADALATKTSTIAGLRSAGFQRAQDLASADVTRGLGMATSQAGLDQQVSLANADATNRAALANQQADLASAGVRAGAAQAQFGMGTVEQQTQQADYDVNYDEFLRRINDPFQKQQFAIGALTGVSPAFSTSTQTTRMPGPSAWNAVAGGASIAAGLASFAHGGEVDGYWGGGGGGALAPRRRPEDDPSPGDPELLLILEGLREDPDAGAEPGSGVSAVPQAGLGAPAAAVPASAPGAGVGEAPGLAPGGYPLGFSLNGATPGERQISLAGVPVEDGHPSLRPQVAGLGQPLVMPSPAAYSVPREGSMVTVNDPVLAARYALESGGNIAAQNQRTGASGAGQWMPSRLVDLGVYTPGEGEVLTRNGRAVPATWQGRFSIPGLPEVRTQQDFLNSREAQEVVERLNREWEDRTIRGLGLDRFIGQEVAGARVSEADLRHALHFAGAAGAHRYFSSGGQHNPSDGNMTVREYLAAMRQGGARSGGGRPAVQALRGAAAGAGDVVAAAQPQAGLGAPPAQAPGGGGQGADGADAATGEPLTWWQRVRRGLRDPAHEDAALPMGLIASGLGMMASPSPHVMQAIGQGGLMGLQFVQQARSQRGQDRAAAHSAAHRDRMATVAERRASAAEEAARQGRQQQNTTRYLSAEEVAARGFRPGTVVTETVGPDGRVVGVQAEQQPRERQLPAGYEEDPERPGAVRRLRGYQEERPLTPQAIRELSDAGGLVSSTQRLRSSFRADYRTSVPYTGDLQNWIGRNVGLGLHDQAQWWQDYQGWANQIRHQFFGSALTATEARNFDRFAINPNMTPEAIMENLGRQERIARGGALRQAAGFVRSGYSAEAVAGALGFDVEEVQQAARARPSRAEAEGEGDAVPARAGDRGATGDRGAAPPRPASDSAAPVRVTSEAEVRRLAPGTRFVGPDGVVRVVPQRRAAGGGGG